MRFLTGLGALALAGCATAPSTEPMAALVRANAVPLPTPSEAIAAGVPSRTPIEAVVAAASASGSGVAGVFTMTVRRAEQVGPRLFLNSEADYRDQRNLSVVIHPWARPGLRARVGTNLPRAFLGKDVRVFGHARRVRIDFTANGRPTGKYYYQTHVGVTDARQVESR